MSKTTSTKQIQANQNNAKQSTGPKTTQGKQLVATNATKHGIFSSRLVLQCEDPAEYQNLLYGLEQSLKPEGILEQALVERIAVTLWRQQRLIKAENARTHLELLPDKIDRVVNKDLGDFLYGGPHASDARKPANESNLTWCKGILSELDKLNQEQCTDEKHLSEHAPLCYRQLCYDAEGDKQTVMQHLEQHDKPEDYFWELRRYCEKKLADHEKCQDIKQLITIFEQIHVMPIGEMQEKLSKYQLMLDNELYKALKSLREAQAWRIEQNGFVLGNAA